MSFTSDYATVKVPGGKLVTRNKHGLSGQVIKDDSYLNHITNTLTQLSVDFQKQEAWPGRIRPSFANKMAKLHRYAMFAGFNVFDHKRAPSQYGINVGWAGKKRKQQMLELDQYERPYKHPKIYRRMRYPTTFRFMGGRAFIKLYHAIPTTPLPEPTIVPAFDTVLECGNGKSYHLLFKKDGVTVFDIPFKFDRTLPLETVVNAWSNLKFDDGKKVTNFFRFTGALFPQTSNSNPLLEITPQ